MHAPSSAIRRAALAMIGTIIGAGVFALPAMFARVGFWPATVLFWLIAMAVLIMHLLFVDVQLILKKRRRLPGYVGAELGPVPFWIASITYPFASVGVLLVYVILGGEFLAMLARPLGLEYPFLWQMLFWLVGALVVFFGLKLVARVEAAVSVIKIASMFIILALFIFLRHGISINTSFADWSSFSAPFGVFLFSLAGLSVVSEAVEITGRQRRAALEAVAAGTLAAAFLSWLFGAGIFLAVGARAGGDPLALAAFLPSDLWWLIPFFGFLAVGGAFLMTAQDLTATFHLDYHLNKLFSWILAFCLPLILFLVTARNFLQTIDVVGTIFGGIDGILVGMMAVHLFRRRHVHGRLVWWYALPMAVLAIFSLGMLSRL